MYKLNNEAEFTGGDPSVLGYLTGNAPNLFFKPSENQQISKNTLSITGKAGLQYKLNEYGNVFVNYSRGRRPNVLQFTATGEEEILDAEILDNFDAGFKASVLERYLLMPLDFTRNTKISRAAHGLPTRQPGEFNYKIIDGGKATTYGAEATLNVAVVKQLELFGNYAWLHTAFDSTNTDGLEQEYAGNSFALAPEHSFTAGFNAQVNLTKNLQIFVSPSYSYKTHIYFTDANTEGLDQEAYGLLNVNGGLKLAEPKLMLSVYATNLLGEEYVTSGGNAGSLFGVPTFVPGSPQMFGAKVTWAF
jgi:iron complex outermembrane recepter protein